MAEKYPRMAQSRWDRCNLRSVSTKLSVQEYYELLDLCVLAGCTPYTYLRRLLRQRIAERRGGSVRVW